MERLKKLREKRGLTQTDVANYLSVGKNTISRYEGGEREPDRETLLKLAEYFETTVGFLIGETDDPAPPRTKKAPPEISTEEALRIGLRGILGHEPTEKELRRFYEMGKVFFNIEK